jgi:hypothetical protein
MSIFEDKKHNDPKYVGQKPVRTIMAPEDTRDATMGLINHAVEQPMSVRNLANKKD